MAATITVSSNLGASYDTLNKGTQLIVTSDTDDIVSFTYMLTPGGNATGNAYDNSFITKTLIVGSDAAVHVSTNQYLLFIEEDETLCADDFYVIISARNAGGASLYTEPETIYLTPIAPTVTGAVLERTGSSGYEDGILTVTLAEDVTCGKTVKMYFVLQFQEVGQTGYSVERIEASQVGSSLQYTADVDGLDQYGIVDDSLFVAVQAVRTIGSTEASSDLSNTVQATDSDQQLPPVNLRINYQSAGGDNGTTDVLFNNPPTYQVVEPASFNIYKQINVYEGADLSSNVIGTVAFDASNGLAGDYSFQDPSANLYPDSMGAGNLPLNSVITYWATAVDGASESVPSNSESATVVVPSSAPEDLEGTALINTDGSATTYSDGYTSLILSFTSPSDIEGETNDVYNPARYEVTVNSNDGLIDYTSNSGDWLYADYPGSGVPITLNFPDEELDECTEGAILTVTVRLITSKGYDNSSDDLDGVVATKEIIAHTRPVITDINGVIGENDFTRANLQTFKVYYFGTLVPPGVSLLVENSDNELQIVEGAFMQTQSGTVPDGYYRYAGAYEKTYTIAGSAAAGKDALMITACNTSGFTQTRATLPTP